VLDVEDFRTADKAGLLRRVYEKDRQAPEAREAPAPDAALGSACWSRWASTGSTTASGAHGSGHHKYEAGNPFEHAIRDYYRHVDAQPPSSSRSVPPTRSSSCVGPRGKKDGASRFNEWLIREGFLTRDRPTKPTPSRSVAIDWPRTKAWGDGGYYGPALHDVACREPAGTIDPAGLRARGAPDAAASKPSTDPSVGRSGPKATGPRLYRAVMASPRLTLLGDSLALPAPVVQNAIHLFRPVVRHDEDERVGGTERDELGELRVDVAVVVADRVPRTVAASYCDAPDPCAPKPCGSGRRPSHQHQKSQGRVRSRCFASFRCLSVFSYTRRRSPALSAVRKSSTSST